ncbi:MAG: hypothetical protein ACI9YE_003588 [Psychroserpens sp.]
MVLCKFFLDMRNRTANKQTKIRDVYIEIRSGIVKYSAIKIPMITQQVSLIIVKLSNFMFRSYNINWL